MGRKPNDKGIEKSNYMLAYNLKKLRKETGLTQVQVAEKLNIERSTYTYYETGKTTPNLNTIMAIAKLYNIPYSNILNGIDTAIPDIINKIESVNTKSTDNKNTYENTATTKDEMQILFFMRQMSIKNRKMLLAQAKIFADIDT